MYYLRDVDLYQASFGLTKSLLHRQSSLLLQSITTAHNSAEDDDVLIGLSYMMVPFYDIVNRCST